MYMSECCPLMAIVLISLFLTVSFFVLFTLRKIGEKWLKVFGYVAVSFLLLAVLVFFKGAASNMIKKSGGLKCMVSQKMKMDCMSRMMRQKNMPEMAIPGK
ncbi:MAG: hypothetical protein KJ710_02660 [Candidatus Omnitrophica bacterium]|nr:hypothetical protein [Candidatus Omnitrophota bacterium]MBU1923149.1 hypothetical protein [Candidatus Omnitrophota bacterium]